LSSASIGALLARATLSPARLYFRSFPLRAGKLWVWDHIIRPYVGWRPITTEAVTVSGLRLQGQLSDTIHGAVYFFGMWEPALTRYLNQHLDEGDVLIDVGANVGVHTMLAAQRVGPTGRVHAIEASPRIHAILRANLAANGLHNVTTYNLAAADRAETVTLSLHDQNNLGTTTTRAEPSSAAVVRETVQAMPLPDIVPRADLRRARMIKIDVEGAEWSVLQGLAPVMAELRPDISIVVEVDREALASQGVSVAQFLEFFESRGYQAMRLPDHSAALCINGAPTDLVPVNRNFEMADLLFRRGGVR
jgi:FkbM family methyltransferase